MMAWQAAQGRRGGHSRWKSAESKEPAQVEGGVLRVRLMTALLVVAVVIGVVPVIASSALAAEAPRWNIVSTSNPTNLVPNAPKNEVQDVVVDATGGTFILSVTGESHTCSATDPIPYNATAAEFQATLELCVGAGNIAVTGGPGNVAPYVVTFIGELADSPIPVMTANSSSLTGGAATATATETVNGAFVPVLTVTATNVGGVATDGSTITLGDSLPSGLTATAISGYDAYAARFAFAGNPAFGGAMSCSPLPALSCTYSGSVDPGDTLVVTIPLDVESSGSPPNVLNQASVTGGGAVSEATVSTPIMISDTPAAFGPSAGSVVAATSTSQAGAHPNVTTTFALNTRQFNGAAANVKDVRFDLPPGLVGSTVGMPKCTMAVVLHGFQGSKCPGDTMVGIATVTIGTGQLGPNGGPEMVVVPVYNITPAPGEPAAFALNALLLPVRLDTSVLSNGTYGVRVTAPDVSEAAVVLSTSITIWGVPADHTGPGVSGEASIFGQEFGGPNPGQTRVPLLTNPQQCSEPLSAAMSTDAWTNPGVFVAANAPMGMLAGCDQLSLESSFKLLPDTLEAGVPAGYSFDLNVPQRNEPDGLATPNVKNVRLTLPVGVVVNPSAAWGLKACSDAQFFGPNRGRQEPAQPGNCPREAQVGKVRVKTPALEEALEGEVYLAEPECNPCTPEDAQDGKMIRLFLQVVSEGEGGIIVKLAGRGSINQQTGQITTTFENDPQLPFDSLKLELGGGPRATLANPRTCGPATSNLDLTPWSTPLTSDSTPFYDFDVNQGCFGPQFNPSFAAGLTNIQAGAYGPFTLSFGRGDHDQFLSGIELKTPPGLLGSLAHVPLCAEPQAAQGTCPQQSLIGHTQVLTGPGADPFLVTGGQVFLTEGYKGAPFGLSIVVPAVAGPYTLSGTTGHGTVVERAQIFIDPQTAALTVKSDPLPTVLDGIPLQLKVVNVTIDRDEFMFGPTNCAKLQIAGTLSSLEGMSAPVASPFQVTNCASLAFKPKFTVSTSGKTSKANGASLSVKLVYPNAPQGAEANIHSVKVDLPKQLPSRLTTLQKACTAAQFEANPAGCPAASIVGHAKATTPLLPVPVEGPAYFVSHGGEAFPSLILVLQGYGVRIDLVGTTFISKAGITSSTFKTVPDVPVGSFELNLPQGKFSALTANGNLCRPTRTVTVRKRVARRVHGRVVHVERTVKQTVAQPLQMPTGFVAQNGAQFSQTTKIAVTGCPKKLGPQAQGKGRGKKR
jgi:hypothetical protein